MSQNLRNRSRGVPPGVVALRRRRLRQVSIALFAGSGVVAAFALLVGISMLGVPTVLTLLLTGPAHSYGSTSGSSSTSTSSTPMWTPTPSASGTPSPTPTRMPDAGVAQEAAATGATPTQKSSGASSSAPRVTSTPATTASPSPTPPGNSGSAPGHTKGPAKSPTPQPAPTPQP